jgi:hypothetical protein
VAQLFPPDCVIERASLSPKALAHGKGSLAGKIFLLREYRGGKDALLLLRLLHSGGRAKGRQSAACFILVFCSLSAHSSTFTATLKNGTGTTVTTAYLHFELWNCGTNFPTVLGQPQTIVQFTFDLKANPTTGVITGTVLGNDVILCGNVASTE